MTIAYTLQVLGPLSGDAFWTAFHTELDASDQQLAEAILAIDWTHCGWSPGPDTWVAGPPYVPPVCTVGCEPPPYVPPDVPGVPEPATWLMMLMGALAMALYAADKKRKARL